MRSPVTGVHPDRPRVEICHYQVVIPLDRYAAWARRKGGPRPTGPPDTTVRSPLLGPGLGSTRTTARRSPSTTMAGPVGSTAMGYRSRKLLASAMGGIREHRAVTRQQSPTTHGRPGPKKSLSTTSREPSASTAMAFGDTARAAFTMKRLRYPQLVGPSGHPDTTMRSPVPIHPYYPRQVALHDHQEPFCSTAIALALLMSGPVPTSPLHCMSTASRHP